MLRIDELEGENGQLKENNETLIAKNLSDAKAVGSLTKENKELAA